MDNRFNEMEELIKKLGSSGIIDKNNIYYELCKYGLSDEERESKNLLVEDQNRLLMSYRYKKRSYCGVINSFFIFRERHVEKMRAKGIDEEAVKLYIPTNKENIQEVASKLFDYLVDFYVEHETKISKDIRSDDIVTRIYDNEPVNRIIKFVNEELFDKLIKTNPFVMREGAVGIARDGKLSYNERISKVLSEYLSANIDDLENVDLAGFRQYMKDIRDKSFKDKEYIRKLLIGKDREIYKTVSDLDYVYDNATVNELITIAIDEEKGIEDFNEYWELITNEEKKEELMKNFSDILEEIQEKSENDKTIENDDTLKKSLVEKILDQQKIIAEQKKEIVEFNNQKGVINE